MENLLGEFGRQILYFYEANQLIISLVVITYGIILFLSWSNTVKIYRFLVIEVAKQIHTRKDLDKESSPKKVIKKVSIPWGKAIEKSRFPFVAKMSGLWPRRKSIAVLKELLVIEDIAEHALAVNNGRSIKKITPISKHMLARDIENIKEKNSK